ncbi:MAG: YqhA family protein [Thiotrichaceae bacterium]
MNIRDRIEGSLETLTYFQSRWILAPLYVGLVIALGLLVIKFWTKMFYIIPHMLEGVTLT